MSRKKQKNLNIKNIIKYTSIIGIVIIGAYAIVTYTPIISTIATAIVLIGLNALSFILITAAVILISLIGIYYLYKKQNKNEYFNSEYLNNDSHKDSENLRTNTGGHMYPDGLIKEAGPEEYNNNNNYSSFYDYQNLSNLFLYSIKK